MQNPVTFPAWRYHKDHAAKIFETENEIIEAEASGWRDSPAATLPAIDIDGACPGVLLAGVATLEAAEEVAQHDPQACPPGFRRGRLMPVAGVEAALEVAPVYKHYGAGEEAIEEVQKVVAKRRRR